MRSLVRLSMAVVLFASAASAADEHFPSIVGTTGEEAPLRSGPGEDYYATALVPSGTPLEAWRRTPDGWYAVRPPRGSFSLVAADELRVQPGHIAEVVRPRVPARIGTVVEQDPDVVQVFLNQGERVQVLKTVTLDGQFWHHIAPPSGEFRWVHESHVSRSTDAQEPAESQRPAQLPVDATGSLSGPYRIARLSPAAESPRTPADSVDTENNLATANGSDDVFTLVDIELELATIVAEDPSLWHFSHLRQRCQELQEQDATDAGKDKVEEILDKIARFERIKTKRQSLLSNDRAEHGLAQAASAARSPGDGPLQAAPQETGNERNTSADREVTWRAARGEFVDDNSTMESEESEIVRIPERPVDSDGDGERYDGLGTLRPVVSRRRDAPRYALVDGTGDVVTFVTPSPGVNLQPYIGKRIGVVGTRGYMPEFKRNHVTAARVMPLR